MTQHTLKSANFYAADYRAEDSVGFLMKAVMLSITASVNRRLSEHGLTYAQWGPLLMIQQGRAYTVAELARWSNTDAGAMTRLLDRLEAKGLLKRVRSTEDRRVVKVELTTAGTHAIRDVPAILADVLNAHLSGFSKAEWETMKSYLSRMLANGEILRAQTDATDSAQ
jgi:DNA-binding MarR family transcriptional regulator